MQQQTQRPAIALTLTVFILVQWMTSLQTHAQSREEKVRNDRLRVEKAGLWIYNDLDTAFQRAKTSGKPLLVILRCIPCEECVKLDDDLVDDHPAIRPLLEQFVCARQVSTNGLDLELFQYDTDQSFAVFMLNADGTIYGRFGTRSHRTEWLGDVSLDGLAAALQGGLDLHSSYPSNKELLAGKRGKKPEFASPEQFPMLKQKYTDSLDNDGDIVKSCIHCHQIGEARRDYYWQRGVPIPEEVMFPYPHPKSVGMVLDPRKKATIKSIKADSVAETAGLLAGDEIVSMGGQPLLSIADIQWVLHQTDADGERVPLVVKRSGQTISLSLDLAKGWRQDGDLSWRVTSWSYRRITLGGLQLRKLDSEKRQQQQIPAETMALRVSHMGQYGPHGSAKRAGFEKDDILIRYNDRDDLNTETDLFRYALSELSIGDKIEVVVLRQGQCVPMTLHIQK